MLLRLPTMLFPLLAAWSTLLLLSVYFIEHMLGYLPCQMCLWQRVPWFFVIIISLLGLRFQRAQPSAAIKICHTLLMATLLVSIGLAAYHTGVEWRWWQGPTSCSGVDAEASFEALKQALLSRPPVRCDAVEFRLFGGSLALWNVLVSLLCLLVVLAGAWRHHLPPSADKS